MDLKPQQELFSSSLYFSTSPLCKFTKFCHRSSPRVWRDQSRLFANTRLIVDFQLLLRFAFALLPPFPKSLQQEVLYHTTHTQVDKCQSFPLTFASKTRPSTSISPPPSLSVLHLLRPSHCPVILCLSGKNSTLSNCLHNKPNRQNTADRSEESTSPDICTQGLVITEKYWRDAYSQGPCYLIEWEGESHCAEGREIKSRGEGERGKDRSEPWWK